jgi:hypothetical protein
VYHPLKFVVGTTFNYTESTTWLTWFTFSDNTIKNQDECRAIGGFCMLTSCSSCTGGAESFVKNLCPKDPRANVMVGVHKKMESYPKCI